ncbi:hypothetical protein [Marinobacter salexigens]|uniref:hypothetical protein n=1 Tax=Marinobacter salexigens TaxID=1925763 RepID=UPI00128FF2F4|nr:hypothetical protein [Marinobacter salexigens]
MKLCRFERWQEDSYVETYALIIQSPGQVDMAGITVMASALGVPVQSLSQDIYRAPSVLARNIPADNLQELLSHCARLGLDVTSAANDATVPQTVKTFQLAVYIADSARIPHAVETIARVTGVAPDQVFRMLAMPPGLVLGNVSHAAVEALRERLGTGIELMTASEDKGLFDLYLTQSMASLPAISELAGSKKGLIPLGLAPEQAKALYQRIPKGIARLIPRGLLRFDVVLASTPPLSCLAAPVLAELFGVTTDQIPLLQTHAPLALAERLPFDEASAAVSRCVAAGLPVTLEASGFERCDLVVEDAPDRNALANVLAAAGKNLPEHLPARVGTDLPDLDARWLAYSIEKAGAPIRFEEVAP